MAATIGMCSECLQWQMLAGSCNSLGCAMHSPRVVGPIPGTLSSGWLFRLLGRQLLTGPLVAAVAVVDVCAYLWGPRQQPWLMPGAHVGAALLPVSARRRKLLWWDRPSACTPPTMVPFLSGKARLLPGLPHLWCTSPFRLVFIQPTPVPSLGSDLQSLSLSTQPPPTPACEKASISVQGVPVGTDPLCGTLSALPSAHLLLRSPLRL